MHKKSDRVARIGIVHYINMAPIYETWKEREHDSGWQLVEEHPAALNKKLAAGEIDLGFVSCHEYGLRPERYQIMSDLSISANGPVGSVFLFSKIEPEKLAGADVLLSSESNTSVCLVRIILEKFFSVKPHYVIGNVASSQKVNCDAVLAIGDDALRLYRADVYRYCLDLGEVWKKHTGLPFVFAVCAVREEFCRNNDVLTNAIHRELIYCRDKGIEDLRKICTLVAPRIPMGVEQCLSYLSAIKFDLDNDKKKALEMFFSYLACFDEAQKSALPLKIRNLD